MDDQALVEGSVVFKDEDDPVQERHEVKTPKELQLDSTGLSGGRYMGDRCTESHWPGTSPGSGQALPSHSRC